jgi:hypothetical protein
VCERVASSRRLGWLRRPVARAHRSARVTCARGKFSPSNAGRVAAS